MPDTPIGQMLQAWQHHVIEHSDKEEFPIAMARRDIIRLKALAEVYRRPLQELVADLLNTALNEVEAKMPYVAGPKVIRVEENEPIYEDIGLTPTYLNAKKRLESELDEGGMRD